MPKIFTQGRSNFGNLGNTDVQSNRTEGTGGKFQITTAPPQSEHQMTGTMVVLSSLVVVIQVFVVIPLDVMSSVDTPVGTVVIVDVISGVSEAVLVEVDVAEVGAFAPSRDVVLPSMFRIPEEANEMETVPLVKADPPGVNVKDPRTIPEPLPDAIMLGARVIPEVVEVVTPVVEVVAPVPRGMLFDWDVVPLLFRVVLDIDEVPDEPPMEDEDVLLVAS